MSNYFDKKDVLNIKRLNEVYGMKHRCRPLDISNSDDLYEYLKYKSCAFLDYLNYYNNLDSLLGNFDESLEHYDTATWINLTMNVDKVDKLSYEAYIALREAEFAFFNLVEKAELECAKALKIVLMSSKELQIFILGRKYNLDEDIVEKVIKKVFDDIHEVKYHYNMEKLFDGFIEYVNDILNYFIIT